MKHLSGVRIPSMDAKDLYLSNHLIRPDPQGYSLIKKDGTVNLKRYLNTLDYSLDLIRLREVYFKVYRNKYFSFEDRNGYEYSSEVCNVTFKYSVKEFNQIGKGIYVRTGYNLSNLTFRHGIAVIKHQIVGINTDLEVSSDKVASEELLEDYFYYDRKDKKYHIKRNRTLLTIAQLRDELYEKGFILNGKQYVRFKRSSGSSRVGKCLFIDQALYSRMHKYEMTKLKIKDGQDVDLAALEAYIALTLSSIIGTIHIKPENILVIDDYDSIFSDKVITTRIKDGKLVTQEETAEIKNSIWDGESLIDISIMEEYSQYGMILLRNNFFKSCAFNTNIQQFFKDNDIVDIKQLNGFTLASEISQIKFITTPNSIKYLKFGSVEEWLKNIDSMFGVVKHEKKTHFFNGRMVQSHYQLLNTLQLSKNEMKDFLKPTFDYMDKFRTDPAVFRYHIHYPAEHRLKKTCLKSNDAIVFQMMGINNAFCNTKMYREFVNKNTKSYKKNLRYGHVLIEGNYSTLFGNPYEMLLQSIGAFKGDSVLGVGNVHSKRFQYGEKLLGSRSPHIAVANILLTNNIASTEIDTYFNLTTEIVCINSIGENILQRLQGADFDSDTILLTNNPLLIHAAKRNYDKFLVPTNFVESKKTKRQYTKLQQSDLDIKTSVNKIGEIVNLSQEIQSYMWHLINNGASFEEIKPLYFDVCQLSVMSGLEIDSAKKEFEIKNVQELRKLRKKHLRKDENGRTIKPYFFAHIAKTKGYYDKTRMNYTHMDTSMDYLEELINAYRAPRFIGDPVSISGIFNTDGYNSKLVKYDQIKKIMEIINKHLIEVNALFANPEIDNSTKHATYEIYQTSVLKDISKMKISRHTLLRLIQELENDENSRIRGFLNEIVFSIGHDDAFSLIKDSIDNVDILEECLDGDIDLYGIKFKKNCKYSKYSSNCAEYEEDFLEELPDILSDDENVTLGEVEI